MCHFSFENDLNLNGIYIIGYEIWFTHYSHKYMLRKCTIPNTSKFMILKPVYSSFVFFYYFSICFVRLHFHPIIQY